MKVLPQWSHSISTISEKPSVVLNETGYISVIDGSVYMIHGHLLNKHSLGKCSKCTPILNTNVYNQIWLMAVLLITH